MKSIVSVAKYELDHRVSGPFRRNTNLLAASAALYLIPALVAIGAVGGRNFESVILNTSVESLSPEGSERPAASDLLLTNFFVTAMLISGTVLLGLTTMMILLVNGVMHGYAFAMTVQATDSIPIAIVLWIHAIIELPAIWMAGAAGLKIPYHVQLFVRRQSEYLITKENIHDTIWLAVISFILMIFAILLESYFTIWLARAIA